MRNAGRLRPVQSLRGVQFPDLSARRSTGDNGATAGASARMHIGATAGSGFEYLRQLVPPPLAPTASPTDLGYLTCLKHHPIPLIRRFTSYFAHAYEPN